MSAAELIDQAVTPMTAEGCFASGNGKFHSDTGKNPRPLTTTSMAKIVEMMAVPQSCAKDNCKWIIPSSLLTRCKSAQLESGRFWALWGDLDGEQITPTAEVAGIVSERLSGAEVLAYSSSSATEERQKARIIVYLESHVDGVTYQRMARAFNDLLAKLGLEPDRKTESANQVLYLPNRGDFYATSSAGVHGLAPAFFAEEVAAIEVEEAAQEAADKAARVISAEALQARMAKGEKSPITAFNACYDVETMWRHYGATGRSGRLLSPHSDSGSPAITIKDGKWFSSHGSDLALGIGRAKGGACWGDAFDLFKYFEHGNDESAAVKAAGALTGVTEQNRDAWRAARLLQRQAEAAMPAKAALDTEQDASQAVAGFGAPQAITEDSSTVPFDLSQFSLNGKSQAMRSKMMADKYVLGRIAILGQATAIYAKPNSGKTLLTLHLLIESVAAGNINGADVFYINADDTYKGLVQKLELAEKYGFWMLAPGHGNFDSDMLLRILQKMIEEGTATGKVLILDTLKKFTDIMDKRVSSNFGKVMREFVSHGGTLIMLAHTNKNRDTNGKVVFSGTSDIVDDADCAYTLDATDTGSDTKTVLFENFKQRGDVAREVAYTYSTTEKQNYLDLLESVCELDEAKKQAHQDHARIVQMLERNTDIIEAITEALDSGVCLKTELIDQASKASGISKPKIGKALDAHTGKEWQSGHRWYVTKAEKNAKIYHRLDVWAPKPKDDYQSAKDGE